MSSSIWTQCAGASEIHALRVLAWRAVEAQHLVSTRKLVDSAEEQALLEELIDDVKPPVPEGSRLHYLLFTPFRYPPLRHGSRFGTRHERGIWYGSLTRETAFAEVAYYRLLFLEGTSAALEQVTTVLTAFTVRTRSAHGIDLSKTPFVVHRRSLTSRTRYAATQQLGQEMRSAGVELIRYPSARDPEGINVAAFSPDVFGSAKPQRFETWHCTATRDGVDLISAYTRAKALSFPRDRFLVKGVLPAPAL